MRIFIWNVNGLAPTHRNIVFQHSSLKGFFDHHQVDVICFQETKLQENKLTDSLTTVKDFESFWACSKARKGYSGVSIWVSRNYSPLTASVNFLGGGLEDFDQEGRVIMVDLGSFVLLNVYVPNAGDPPLRSRLTEKLKFLQNLKLKIEELHHEDRKVLVVGDFNVAATDRDLHSSFSLEEIYCPEEIESFQELLTEQTDIWRFLHPDENNQFTVFNEKKGYRELNKGLRIDYALASPTFINYVVSCEILPTPRKWSDHTALILELKDIPFVKSHKPCSLSSMLLFKKQPTLISMFNVDDTNKKKKKSQESS